MPVLRLIDTLLHASIIAALMERWPSKRDCDVALANAITRSLDLEELEAGQVYTILVCALASPRIFQRLLLAIQLADAGITHGADGESMDGLWRRLMDTELMSHSSEIMDALLSQVTATARATCNELRAVAKLRAAQLAR